MLRTYICGWSMSCTLLYVAL
uniref:Uncharacterized protein n=1 Tax=Rhizophora mucronata TaxID=61149 RepID=A0A2P2N9S2_RHIMU